MTALICGSLAFDNIMVFPGRFKDHILPDKIHMLNVAFLVPELRREFGGCAGNIAYNLKLLGGDGVPMGTVGRDFAPYAEWLHSQAIDGRFVRAYDDQFTAQAYITTDLDDNQITAFHPGAMANAHEQEVPTDAGMSIGIVSPDGKDGMGSHARQFASASIPFIFDPGQALPQFEGPELLEMVELATWLTVNDYEMQLVSERTGLAPKALAERVSALVVTRGGEGSEIHSDGGITEIPAAKVSGLADPTGCGDAYRAGLLYGLMNELGWEVTGRLASLMGAVKIESHGTQNHRPDLDELGRRYRDSFGAAAPW
ncbi:MAG: carbohydrate kinase family protein [Pseudomonadota bacterium]